MSFFRYFIFILVATLTLFCSAQTSANWKDTTIISYSYNVDSVNNDWILVDKMYSYYDELGDGKEHIHKVYDSLSDNWVNQYRYQRIYNNHLLIENTTMLWNKYNNDWNPYNAIKNIYVYDSFNNQTKAIQLKNYDSLTFNWDTVSIINFNNQVKYYYYSDSTIKAKVDESDSISYHYFSDYEIQYKYNLRNNNVWALWEQDSIVKNDTNTIHYNLRRSIYSYDFWSFSYTEYYNEFNLPEMFTSQVLDTTNHIWVNRSRTYHYFDEYNNRDEDIWQTWDTISNQWLNNWRFKVFKPTPTFTKPLQYSSFTTYPNPASDDLTFEFTTTKTRQLNIYQLNGSLIYSDRTSESSTKVNVSNLNVGVYLFEIIDESEIQRGKFLVK